MKTLLLVDIQNDFLPDGALPVPGSDEIVPIVNLLMPRFDLVLATQDWHPANHGSFAASHPGREPFDRVELDGLPQTLWPVHCVQNTGGALLAPGLDSGRIARVFPKGTHPRVDSYSGFYDNGRRESTGLADWLHVRGITALSICGLATDYCVKFTVLDALREGFRVTLHVHACRGVNLDPRDTDLALAEMQSAGAEMASPVL